MAFRKSTAWRSAVKQEHRALREALRGMTPPRAAAHIQSFGLLEDEERVLILCDARRKSCQQAAQALNMSADNVHKLRHRAYRKMLRAGE